ncbi:MAG: hypothetical protein JWP02_1250, partial [Acidimicrobiales bacterium]|nr:hypothetical protein [Acidimicrobiales bacterium]
MADRSLFTGPWTRRQIIAYVIFLVGLGGAIAGLFLVRDVVSKRGLLLIVGGVGVLSGGVGYLLATEDRGTGLVPGERR